ncbi:hypothetical protein AB5N19_07099 [Seiridium cardinale]
MLSIPSVPEAQQSGSETLCEALQYAEEMKDDKYIFLRRDWFPGLLEFESDGLECIKKYDTDLPRVLDKLEYEHITVINRWLNSPDSEILVVDGCEDMGDSAWTTGLLLELSAVVDAASNQIHPSKGITTVVGHFCGENAKKKKGRQEIVVQDLIIQTIGAHIDKFKHSDKCRQAELKFESFQAVAEDPAGLWGMFRRCISMAGVRTIVILIDHVESMFIECQRTGNDAKFSDFVRCLGELVQTTHEDSIVKLIVTSRSSEATVVFAGIKHAKMELSTPPPRYRRHEY